MAGPYNAGAIFKLRIQGAVAGSPPWGNDWQFVLMAPASGLSFADVVADMDEVALAIVTPIAVFQSELWDWTHFSCGELDDSVVSGLQTLSSTVTGTVTDQLLPTQTTAQVSFATGISKRILKKAVPAMTELHTVSTTGQWTTGLQTAISADWGFLRVPIEATNGAWQYCYRDPANPSQAVAFPQSVVLNATPKVQRRRRLS